VLVQNKELPKSTRCSVLYKKRSTLVNAVQCSIKDGAHTPTTRTHEGIYYVLQQKLETVAFCTTSAINFFTKNKGPSGRPEGN